MSVLRVILFGTVTGLSTLSVCFVSADRLAHPGPSAAPPAIARAAVPRLADPAVTGTIVQSLTQASAAPAPRMPNGFDTERLNALMRGETGPAANRKR